MRLSPSRYVTKPRSWDDWNDTASVGPDQRMVVHEVEDGPVKTGLVDQHGHDIYRVPERHAIGFRLK